MKDRLVDVWTQSIDEHREDRGDEQLADELAALVESEVAGVANAEVVVEETEESRRDGHARSRERRSR